MLSLGVKNGGSLIWLKRGLVYAFEGDLSGIPSGRYTIIVEKGGTEGISRSDNRIFINVNPSSGDGRWEY